jgi:tetraacyldisaccharide 4'-kinase
VSNSSSEQAFLALIRGQRRGPWASTLRGGLTLAAGGYWVGSSLRSAAYGVGILRTHPASLPVISVGNLTAGGTGKTPLVIHLARALVARGERPGVLARGYGAARDGDPNDELKLVAREVPQALVRPGRDRVARAAQAVDDGATVLLLDDGFQHRRLRRDRDVVLLDATDPWGPAGVLPRGLLREPRCALRRADVVLLTRAELASPQALAALESEVRQAGFEGPLGHARTVPRGVSPLGGGDESPAQALSGERVIAASGIGNPAAFQRTLEGLGAQVLERVDFPDHHAFSAEDLRTVEARAEALNATRIVVTGKDAVKLEPLRADQPQAGWCVLAIDVELEPAGILDEILQPVEGTSK